MAFHGNVWGNKLFLVALDDVILSLFLLFLMQMMMTMLMITMI